MSGFTMQTLRGWRLGRKISKYSYPPTLEHGKHWDKIGPCVVYTTAGKKEVMKRSVNRNKSEEKTNG
jgi:hypothetical protein